MSEQLKALNVLQQVDIAIAQVNRELAALDPGTELKAQCALADKKLARLGEQLRAAELELRDNELSLKTTEVKKQNFESKLYKGQVTNPKELASVEKEIEMIGRKRSELDQRILELYDFLEKLQTDKAQIDKIDVVLKSRLAKHTAEFHAKSSELNAKLAELDISRQEAIAGVTDKQMLSRYEAIRVRHKDTGLAHILDGRCGGCHVAITPFLIRRVQADEEYQNCESCGRILFGGI